jgi:hypothetical protein
MPDVAPLSDEMLYRTFPQAKKKLYARNMINVTKLTKSDRKIHVFVKSEKLALNKDTQEYKDEEKYEYPTPRMIYSAPVKVNLNLKRYLDDIEHSLFKIEGDGLRLPAGRIWYKGLNSHDRYRRLKESWDAFHEPICVKMDFSRWDMRFNNDLFRIEQNFYKSFYPNDKLLHKLLQWQEDLQCFSYIGRKTGNDKIKFNVPGNKPSGCVNTGLGNSLIVVCIIWGYMRHHSINARLVDDGDDILVICENAHRGRLNGLEKWCASLGTKLTLEGNTTVFDEIVFCQCRPFNGKMIRDPHRVLGRMGGGRSGWMKDTADIMTSVGLCEYIANQGVPLVSAMAYAMYKDGRKRGGNLNLAMLNDYKREEQLHYLRLRNKKHSYEPPTIEDRALYAKMFGVPIETQQQLEDKMFALKYEHNTYTTCSSFQVGSTTSFGDLQHLLHHQL